MEGVASYSHCIEDDSHVMWSMMTGNEVACSCLHMHSAVDVCLCKRNVVSYNVSHVARCDCGALVVCGISHGLVLNCACSLIYRHPTLHARARFL